MIFNRLLAKNFCAFPLALCAFASAPFTASAALAVNDPANTNAPLVRLSLPDALGHQTTYSDDAQGRKTVVAPRGVEVGQRDTGTPSIVEEAGWRARHPAPGSHPRCAALAGPLLRPPQSQTDPAGATTKFTLDANGHVTQETRSVTTSSGLQTLITQKALDANGRILSETDPLSVLGVQSVDEFLTGGCPASPEFYRLISGPNCVTWTVGATLKAVLISRLRI